MQYFKTLVFVLALCFVSCGGKEEIIQNEDNNESSPFNPVATISVIDATPENGNGQLEVTAITSNFNVTGGDQVVRIAGTTGNEDSLIKHQIEIHYTIYFDDMETKANVSMVTHTWGTDLTGSIDGGISVCSASCDLTLINPTLHTIVLNTQTMTDSTNLSTLLGTVVYP